MQSYESNEYPRPLGLLLPASMPVLGTQSALVTPGDISAVIWFDPSDSTTMYQERTGASATTPSGVGDPVGSILNKGSAGGWATASADANRPTLQSSGGLYWLDFDGTNDALVWSSLSSTDDLEVMAAVLPDSVNAMQSLWRWQGFSYFSLVWNSSGSTTPRVISNEDVGVAGPGFTISDSTKYVLGASRQRNTTGGLKSWVNGSNQDSKDTANNQVEGFDLALHYFQGGPSEYYGGNDYGGALWYRVLTTTERANMATYFSAKAGI